MYHRVKVNDGVRANSKTNSNADHSLCYKSLYTQAIQSARGILWPVTPFVLTRFTQSIISFFIGAGANNSRFSLQTDDNLRETVILLFFLQVFESETEAYELFCIESDTDQFCYVCYRTIYVTLIIFNKSIAINMSKTKVSTFCSRQTRSKRCWLLTVICHL